MESSCSSSSSSSSQLRAFLLISMLFFSSATPNLLGYGSYSRLASKHSKSKKPKFKVPKGHIRLPPIFKPPINLPPINLPPVTNPPTTNPQLPPPPKAAGTTCPIDSLKLEGCVNLMGGLVHIGVGDPVVKECCPVLQGLVEIGAAVCLCTTLKLKPLNLKVYVPLALQLLIACGKSPPPAFTCSQ
ncbi:hypothetical protein NMG60_11036371 [Bertholletia excelsa]